MEKTPVAREYLVLKDTQRSSRPNAAPFGNALPTYSVAEFDLFLQLVIPQVGKSGEAKDEGLRKILLFLSRP